MMLQQDTMRNLKEYLITLVLFPISNHNKSKYETHRLWGVLEPRYPRNRVTSFGQK